jgi:hypothetical protein
MKKKQDWLRSVFKIVARTDKKINLKNLIVFNIKSIKVKKSLTRLKDYKTKTKVHFFVKVVVGWGGWVEVEAVL